MDNIESIKEHKAVVYDLLVQIEMLQKRLQEENQIINNLMNANKQEIINKVAPKT